jgi:hypothetical protein
MKRNHSSGAVSWGKWVDHATTMDQPIGEAPISSKEELAHGTPYRKESHEGLR